MIELSGNIGDFIGGFGVIITVIYLAVGVRTNTASNRTSAYQSVVATISSWSTGLVMSKDTMRVMRTGMMNQSNLDADERSQFNLMIVSLLRRFENIHGQYINGFVSEETRLVWAARIKGTVETAGAREVWDSQRLVFSASFREFVEPTEPSHQGLAWRIFPRCKRWSSFPHTRAP